MDFKTRIRNKLWVASVISFVILLIKTFTNIELPNDIDTLVDMLLAILTGSGVLINPTTPGIKD
jgi:uncharacterized membrane protein